MVKVIWKDGDVSRFRKHGNWEFFDSRGQFKIEDSEGRINWLNLEEISQLIIGDKEWE